MRGAPVRSDLTVQRRHHTVAPRKQRFSTFQQRRSRNSTSPHDAQHSHRKTSPQERGLPTRRRSSRLSDETGSPAPKQKSLLFVQRPTLAKNEQIVPLTGNPFFITIFSTRYQLYRLNVPRRIQRLLPCSCVSVFLYYGSRTWEVKYYGDQVFKRVHDGWRKFVADNSLGHGDGGVFELTDSENLHFKVQILRAMVPVVSAKCGDGASEDSPILID